MAKGSTPSQSSSYSSQQETIADLSIIEKLDVIPAIFLTCANAFTALLTRAFRSSGPASYYKYVHLTIVRTLTRRASARQLHYLVAPTDDQYLVVCKKRKFTPNSEILEDGTRAHWLGSSKAEKLIVNFHGGGYVVPGSEFMIEFIWQVVDVLSAQGKSVSALFLSYDLAPTAPYPRQLQQAASLLNHIINNLHYSPENIVIMGDSAGGNLVLSLLSHILHPHPSGTIPTVDLKGENIVAAVLISPWVDFDTSSPSFTTNKYKDAIDPQTIQQWSSAFLADPYPHSASKLDNYNQAIITPGSWWEGLPVEKVLISAGKEEVMIDAIEKFAETLKRALGGSRVELFAATGEHHDQPSIDLQFGYKESDEGEQAKLVKRWIGSIL